MRSNHEMKICAILIVALVGTYFWTIPALAQQGSSEALEQEILVVGKKLSEVKMEFKATKAGKVKRCQLTKMSGDPDLDQLPCQVLTTCASNGFKNKKQLFGCMSLEWKKSVRLLAERRLQITDEPS